MDAASDWLARKLSEVSATILEPRTVARKIDRLSGHRQYAGITLTLKPAKELSIRFFVEPSEADYRWAIEDAIFAELLGHYRQPIILLDVSVDDISEDPVASNYVTFKQVATEAMKEGLLTSAGGTNIVWK